ncbi:hypothetical protein MZK49_22410 [Ensifer sesbaniae]|uniref:hypothetical protein n=1 Tax=Ensifer sesbaniae TaxID=1214071 RepID=UPI002001990C|nr:hypothetical protein [Ensifer sesbaniae]
MRKETPTLDAGQHNLSYLDAGADAHPLEEQLAMLRQMTKELEHEIDDILAEASEVVGVAPDMNRSKAIKGLVADNRKKLLRLQSYLARLEERVSREAINSD